MNNESEHESGTEGPEKSSIGMGMMIGFWILILGFAVLGAQNWLEDQAIADPPRILSVGFRARSTASRSASWSIPGPPKLVSRQRLPNASA